MESNITIEKVPSFVISMVEYMMVENYSWRKIAEEVSKVAPFLELKGTQQEGRELCNLAYELRNFKSGEINAKKCKVLVIEPNQLTGLFDVNGREIRHGDTVVDVEKNIGMEGNVVWNVNWKCWWFDNGDLMSFELSEDNSFGYEIKKLLE